MFIQDGMDQAKFPVPRSGLLRAKRFDSVQRLKLHVGCSKHLSWIPPRFSTSLSPTPRRTATLLMHGLSELLKQGVDLSACGVTLQADNTAREVENSILMRLT